MSSRPRLRALVLTAGFGSRLRPLSLVLPKPLLPIGDEPVAGVTLRRLLAAGCEAAALNLHHLPDAVAGHFGRTYHGLPLVYSKEKVIQGTLGALFPLRDFLSRADVVLLLNGDGWCDWPIEALVRRHLRSGAGATLLLHRRSPEQILGGGVGIDGSGRVTQLRDGPAIGEVRSRHLFLGAHALSPAVLQQVGEGFGDIVAGLYQPLLEQGVRVEALLTRARWHDLGTPGRYLAACIDAARGSGLARVLPWRRGTCVSALAEIGSGTKLHHSQVARGARIEDGVRLEASVVLEGAVVAAGSQISHSIVGPGAVVRAQSVVERRLVCRIDQRHELGAEESVMGDLIYTPL